jgi:UDP-N-acetyl-D-galactosamine dehydrogenase
MPIAVSFSRKADVIGFDVNQAKIDLYRSGMDPTGEVGDAAIAACTVDFTSDEIRLQPRFPEFLTMNLKQNVEI